MRHWDVNFRHIDCETRGYDIGGKPIFHNVETWGVSLRVHSKRFKRSLACISLCLGAIEALNAGYDSCPKFHRLESLLTSLNLGALGGCVKHIKP